MGHDEELPRCAVCRAARTGDAYELSGDELEILMTDRRIRNAAWLHRKYGALPICRACFDGLGFGLEGERPGAPVQIRRRT
jgi:hypothetical protein